MSWKKLMVGVAGALAFSSAQADAPCANCSDWTLSTDGNAVAGSVTVLNGVAEFNGPDGTQPVGVFGAGFTYTGTEFKMEFDADLNTWDSYNAVSGPGTGYYDAFIVTVSTTGFYWTTSHSDPIAATADTFVWGGTNYSDGILEEYTTAPASTDMITMSSGGPTTYYVSLVLDTKTLPQSDSLHPSYGSFHVNVIPEPETYAMLLAGLGLMGFMARRRQRNLAAA